MLTVRDANSGLRNTRNVVRNTSNVLGDLLYLCTLPWMHKYVRACVCGDSDSLLLKHEMSKFACAMHHIHTRLLTDRNIHTQGTRCVHAFRHNTTY